MDHSQTERAMPSLENRLAAALAPQYRIERRVGQGGMGAVFKAYDNSLRRWVAIKVLLPQLATEVAARRFLREARTLASLNHPHIVAVHQVGEAKGLFYFVMEFVEGETLAGVLARGPIESDAVVKLGRDVLDALEAVHSQGRVHCDVKPANIFLTGKRAMLADFGIATSSAQGEETLTIRDFQPHTPRYATPEQVEHREVSPQTDLYALGIVLYEAVTGRAWFDQAAKYDPTQANWSGVPRLLRRVLIRALHPNPEQRWADAREFRQALWRTRSGDVLVPATILTAAAVTGGVLMGVFGQRFVQSRIESEPIVVIRADHTRGVNNFGWRTDSLADFVLERLRLNTDFRTCGVDEGCGNAETELLVSVDSSDSGFVFETRSGDRAVTILSGARSAFDEPWSVAANEMLSGLLLQLYQNKTQIYDDLPTRALPSDVESMGSFIEAERLWHEASWSEALGAYQRASQLDSTCYICSWRITDVLRWFLQPPDSVHRQRVLDNIDLFPPRYRLLIEARLASPVDARLRMLEEVTESDYSFFAAHFEFGDELLHRGALDGFVLERAARELRAAYQRRTSFAPALEHVLWAHLVLRDTGAASRTLGELNALPESDEFGTRNFRLSLAVALAFQTGRADELLAGITQAQPSPMSDERFPVFARIMMGYGTPEGAIGLGRMLENLGFPYPGLFGQYVGHFAMGQFAAARDAVARSRRIEETPDEFVAFAALLDAAAFIADSTLVDPSTIVGAFGQFNSASISIPVRESVAFMQNILNRRLGIDETPINATVQNPTFRSIMMADSLAAIGDLDSALAIAESLVEQEFAFSVLPKPEGRAPIVRSMLYLLRSEWYVSQGDTLAAIASLRWHENTDVYALPLHEPLTYEADWALGTLASWKRAQLLERVTPANTPHEEMCRLYRNVAQLWTNADQPFSRLANEASDAWVQHQCAALMTSS